MIADGLFTRFPRPDFVIAVHDNQNLSSGQIGVTPGFAYAAADTVDVTIFGKGGHGAYPHLTVDPVLLAAKTVVALNTIVSREINPVDSSVITVGSIQGGTKANVIPDEVKLQITVRSYKDAVQKQLLAAIARVVKGEAIAAGAPREPVISVDPHGATGAVFNDEALTARLSAVLARAFGTANVVAFPAGMGSEDFSEYGRGGVRAVTFKIGATEPTKLAAAKAKGVPPPGVHTAFFAPDHERTIRTGVATLTLSALDVLAKPDPAVPTK